MLLEFKHLTFTLIRKRIKNINLRIQRTGELYISAPAYIELETIYSFINDKLEWINTHRSRLQMQQLHSGPSLIEGESIYFLGCMYPLIIHEVLKHPRVVLHEDQLHLYVKTGSALDVKQRLIKKWYHSQMQPYVIELIEKWEAIIQVKVNKISIKSMRSRWGSCHPIKKHISLNLNLIKKPLNCLEYVIVHELVHILEASHNQRFHALMSHYLPDWKEAKRRLEI